MTAVASFYRFAPIADPEALRAGVHAACSQAGLTGTVLIAPEGVNGMLAGARDGIEAAVATCFPDREAADAAGAVDVKWSAAPPGSPVFQRLKVLVKDEIVTFDLPLDARTRVGRRVDARAWNTLLDDPDVLVLDVRNRYESAIGTFRGALRADTENFRDFRDFAARRLDPSRHRRIAMFCTGGIRCEKASAHLLSAGFPEVCQLGGGILQYWAETPPERDAFEGECFVFDERGAVGAAAVRAPLDAASGEGGSQ